MSSAGPRTRAVARREAHRPGALSPDPPGPILTGRAIVLGLLFVLLVFTLAVPVRTLFAQRAALAELRDGTAATALRVEALQQEQARLADPAYVQALVRDRLHYVMPGEIGYTVLGPEEAPAPQAAGAAAPAQAWYARLWSSVEQADGTGPDTVSGEPPVDVRPGAPR